MQTHTTHGSQAFYAIAAATLLLMCPAISEAATIPSKWKSHATGVCQSALPSGAGAVIRARPLAVQNEGSTNAFVTCSLPYNDTYVEQPNANGMGLRIVNNTDSELLVTCTLVSGFDPETAYYVVRNQLIPDHLANVMWFYPSDLPGAPATIPAPNISCSLPPGVGINYVFYYYDRQVGV